MYNGREQIYDLVGDAIEGAASANPDSARQDVAPVFTQPTHNSEPLGARPDAPSSRPIGYPVCAVRAGDELWLHSASQKLVVQLTSFPTAEYSRELRTSRGAEASPSGSSGGNSSSPSSSCTPMSSLGW